MTERRPRIDTRHLFHCGCKHTAALLLTLMASITFAADDFAQEKLHHWHQWRGPLANGTTPTATPPVEWDAEKNIAWKTPLEGEGSGTPIVWQNRVFLLSAVPTDKKLETPIEPHPDAKTLPPENFYQFVVSCFDLESGERLWRKVACEAVPHEGRHTTNTYASASPCTDGQRLYVSFGSRGVYCYDLDGNQLWNKSFGQMRTRYGWGEAVTPALYGDSLVLTWDQEDDSFITVLDTQTGDTRWRQDRDEPTSWATPLIVTHRGQDQVIVNGTNRARAYDLKTGQLIWQCGGQTVNAIPSPVQHGDNVICMSGYRGSAAYSIRLDSKDDLTDQDDLVAWQLHSGTPYVPSPLLYQDRLYFTSSNSAIGTCLDADSGQVIWDKQRLPGLRNMYASPVAANGYIYFVSREGTTLVLKVGDQFEEVATNVLEDPIDASPALVGDRLLLRSANYLYCIQ